MAYKITLVSTHGTGKTTLASGIENYLNKRGLPTKCIGEMATDALEKGLPINEQTTLEAQLFILHRHFEEELRYSGIRLSPPFYKVLVCDRSFDNLCYLEHSLGKDKGIQHARELVFGHMGLFPYDRVYLIPIVSNSIESGNNVRALDARFQHDMDQKIRRFLADHNIEYIELPHPHPNDRFREEWLKIIINQTLNDLEDREGKPFPQDLYIR